jgi:hypothetical protein
MVIVKWLLYHSPLPRSTKVFPQHLLLTSSYVPALFCTPVMLIPGAKETSKLLPLTVVGNCLNDWPDPTIANTIPNIMVNSDFMI